MRAVHATELPARFRPAEQEYALAVEQGGLHDRADRATILLEGNDRKPWLHNLITNAVKTLDDNAGVYAFVCDVRGRVQFDLNVLNLPDRILLDLDLSVAPKALALLDHFLITEDARLRDQTAEWARFGVAGPAAADAARRLGAAHFAAMASLGNAGVADGALLVRHDFSGQPGFELLVPAADAAAWYARLTGDLSLAPLGWDTLNVLRIEHGIPWLGHDIDGLVVPPETGQIERGISYHKGCYVGQEVIERMRSHGVLARRLVKLRVARDGDRLALPAKLSQGAAEVGRVTSLASHPRRGGWVGLGYLRTSVRDATGVTAGEPALEVEIADGG